ncbi:Polysialic acid transport protein KpsM [compost metagenome]
MAELNGAEQTSSSAAPAGKKPTMLQRAFATALHHLRIIGALIMREMATRYGRQGLGFAWLVGEPLIFCFGVMILWSFTKPPYEHGIRLAPFVMTGYMCLILIRHMIGLLTSAVQSNLGLLYHRQVTPMHILSSRIILEIGGATSAFIVVYLVLLSINQVSPPHDYLLLYSGWLIFAFVAVGLALVLTGLAMRFELFERLVSLISYAMIPLSGVFFMVAWVPAAARKIYLSVPFVHGIEMIRAGVFGEFVPTHYNPIYAIAWGAALNIAGLLLIAGAREHMSSE